MAKDTSQDISSDAHYSSVYDNENLKRNANQKYNEMSLHISQNGLKMSTNNKCWRGCGIKRTLLHCWWECKLIQTLWKVVGLSLTKLKNRVAIWYLEKIKTLIWKDTHTPVTIAALFTIAKTWKQPNCPSPEEWTQKTWCICKWDITQT